MAADYDKLFRPHEGMEAPDDMAAQPFFDPSASFPPAPASANLPKPKPNPAAAVHHRCNC